MNKENYPKLALALDNPDPEICRRLVGELSGIVDVFKIGKALFVSEGPGFLKEFPKADFFLDLKFHDIPNTVYGAVRNAASLGAKYLTIHAAGGEKMINAARSAVDETGSDTKILAVTVLTSLSAEDLENQLLNDFQGRMLALGRIAKNSGAHGIVSSAKDLEFVKSELGDELLYCTPGIRGKGESSGDQKRVVTPEDAVSLGADLLVVGRSIWASDNPVESGKKIKLEMNCGNIRT